MNFGLDLQRNQVVGVSIKQATRSASVNGSGVDLGECEGPVTAVLFTGTLAGGGPLLDVKLQESKNDNTADASGAADAYADITSATFAQLTGADDDVVKLLTIYNRAKRYVRAVGTQTGSATNLVYGVVLMSKSKSY